MGKLSTKQQWILDHVKMVGEPVTALMVGDDYKYWLSSTGRQEIKWGGSKASKTVLDQLVEKHKLEVININGVFYYIPDPIPRIQVYAPEVSPLDEESKPEVQVGYSKEWSEAEAKSEADVEAIFHKKKESWLRRFFNWLFIDPIN